MFKPENTNISATIYYIPYAPEITIASTLDLPIANWYEYLIYSAAAECLAKQESDTAYCMKRMDSAMKDVMEQVANRDESSPESVVNIYRQNTWDYY